MIVVVVGILFGIYYWWLNKKEKFGMVQGFQY
jgi:hypothetical protein